MFDNAKIDDLPFFLCFFAGKYFLSFLSKKSSNKVVLSVFVSLQKLLSCVIIEAFCRRKKASAEKKT